MTISNTNPMSSIIAGVMNDATKEGNRQADLTVAMFESEATFSTATILNIFRKPGAEKSAMIDDMLSAVSPDFEAVRDRHAMLSEAKPPKGEKRRKEDVFAIDSLFRKIRAARIMFERAMKSTYWLRHARANKIATNKIGTGALKVRMPDPEVKDADEFINEMYTCTQLASHGDTLIRETLGTKKPAKSGATKNPQANVIADASKSLAAVLSSIATNGKRQAITDFSDPVEADLEVILREVFAAKFADDRGVIDTKAAREWMDKAFAPAKSDTKTKAAA